MKITAKEFIRFLIISIILSITNMMFGEFKTFDMVGVTIISCIILYRKKSLFIIFVYCLIEGLRMGFSPEWFPHIYVWMLLYILICWLAPVYKRDWKHFWIYIAINAFHGLIFGALYSVIYGPTVGMGLTDIFADITHDMHYYLASAVFNALTGTLIIPIAIGIKKLDKLLNIKE